LRTGNPNGGGNSSNGNTDETYSYGSANDETENKKENDFHSSKLSVYPNPNKGIFTLLNNSEELFSDLIIHDLTGRTVYSGRVANNQTNELNLQELENGIYILLVKNQSEDEKFKLVISRN
jgi:hypothetical protein